MLRSDIAPEKIQVGMVWTAPIERSREHGNLDPEKDHYQVVRSEIREGARHFVEVLNLNTARPDLAELLSQDGMPWGYAPLQRVVVRGGLSVLGPFRASYDSERRRVILQSVTPGNPQAFRLDRAAFEAAVKVHEFSFTANQWDPKSERRKVDISMVHSHDLTVLEEKGERLDAATDAQVVNWALDLMEIPKKDRQLFKEVLARAGQIEQHAESVDLPSRVARFRALSERHERVVSLGSEVAEIVAGREGFRDLVVRHIEGITAERIAKAVADRREAIERETAEADAKLARLRQKFEGLQGEYARRVEEWERELAEKHAERVRQIDEREAAVERQERELVERLKGLIETYRTESKAFGDRVLAEIPLLQRLGVLDGGGRGTAHAVAPAGPLELPAFLKETRPRSALGEEEFLRQFESLVAHHGFVFDREDLVNFHVLVKTGSWTIVTGPSGLGKSSLPRLYAEALGARDEFLLIPVRPDWLDDRDIVGAFNALSGRYEPAPCGLVDRLIAAQEDERAGRGGIYVVCLDEMNLARVEHYFAQFLSLLEQPPESRELKLFARGLVDASDPYRPYEVLRLGGNLRFVGTVNVDETTHFFSPKIIDRASIAHFVRPDLRLGLRAAARPQAAISVEPVHLDDYLSWVRPEDEEGEALDLILRVDEALRRSRLGLGFRVRDRVLRYISSARPLLGEDRAVDLALLQNVLPGLRPSAKSYRELLKELRALLQPGRYRRTAEILEALEEDPESDFFRLL
jgi:energy-coupling factor transporter ATP-binding protein EcfA2